MKEPNKRMSSAEFSFFVVRLCLMLGCISMIVVLCTAEGTMLTAYNIFLIAILAIVSLVCLLSFIFELLSKKRKGDGK